MGIFSIWESPFPYGDPRSEMGRETRIFPYGESPFPNRVCFHLGTNTHTLDTNKVPHDFHYYYLRYCCKQQGPDHQEHAKRRLLEFLQVAGPPHQDQPTHASVEGLQKGSTKQTIAAKDHCSTEEEKVPFYVTTLPSKWTLKDDVVLSVLGPAKDQGVKVWGRLPSPRILFAQDRGMGGIGEQRKEDPFAVNDKCPRGKARPPRTSPGPFNLPEKRDTISKDRDMPHNLLSASPHHA